VRALALRGFFGFGDAVEPPPAANDPLDVVRRPVTADREQACLGLGRGDTGQRPDLRVRELTARERLRDPGQRRQRSRHANVLSCGARRQADAPRQPVRTRVEAVAPPAALVELADQLQQACGRGIEMSGKLGDLIAQPLEVDDVRRWGSETLHRRVLQERICADSAPRFSTA